ncbi:MAG: U32 family peptidase [Oscillospiraceae bacterium]|nr:U32 family peptidase [Oscillospiraceae bacterium]
MKSKRANGGFLPELLAPAGDMERLRAAVLYGADAIYLGGKHYGMRAAPGNFSPGEMADAVRFCHGHGVKVYVTCNILPTNEEADALADYLRQVGEIGADAIIAADIGVLMLAKRTVPDMDVHISTQAGVTNYLAARELHALGASRVILARELSLGDIAVIRGRTPPSLELEAFVHGAMCVSFSGRCLLSQYMTGRDGNRGMCAQPCRWKYALMEETRPGGYFPAYEENGLSYILNAEDLSMLNYLDKLAQAGVRGMKIEGRAKSAYYTAVVTNAYRIALDLYEKDRENFSPPAWLSGELDKVSHRPYSTGFYFPEKPPAQETENGGYIQQWDVVAVVEDWRDGALICTTRNRFFPGDELELLEPGKMPEAFIVKELRDGEGEPIETANHPMMAVRVPYPSPVRQGSFLRKRKPAGLHVNAPVG